MTQMGPKCVEVGKGQIGGANKSIEIAGLGPADPRASAKRGPKASVSWSYPSINLQAPRRTPFKHFMLRTSSQRQVPTTKPDQSRPARSSPELAGSRGGTEALPPNSTILSSAFEANWVMICVSSKDTSNTVGLGVLGRWIGLASL
eukprot:1160509-Pelagomonas_calceolata.AAC.7